MNRQLVGIVGIILSYILFFISAAYMGSGLIKVDNPKTGLSI